MCTMAYLCVCVFYYCVDANEVSVEDSAAICL